MEGPRFWRRRAPEARAEGASPPEDDVGRAIAERWRRGDQSAFSDLFRIYRSQVYGVLFHLLPHDPELDDVVQAAFLEIFRSLSTFEGRSRLGSWITRVALHVGYHHLRHRKSRPPDYEAERKLPELIDRSPGADPLRSVERREAAAHVYAILETMAPRKRTVFILNDLQGLPQEEVAEIVGSNVATVRTRLFYARREFWDKARQDPVLAPLSPGAEEAQDAKRTTGPITLAATGPSDNGDPSA